MYWHYVLDVWRPASLCLCPCLCLVQVSLGLVVLGWLDLSLDRGWDVLLSRISDSNWSENRRRSPFPVPPTINKVAVEMNLSESCFLELKPESLRKGETLACSWRAVGYYSNTVEARVALRRREGYCVRKGIRAKDYQLVSRHTIFCASA